jgi:hypothetical protein
VGSPFGPGTKDEQAITDLISPGVADTEFPVLHGLGRVPAGFDVTYQDKAGTIYVNGKANLGETIMYLACSTATMTFDLRVF